MRAQRFDGSGIAIGVPGSYKPSRLKLQSRADDYDARRDKDTLGLECLPGKEAADPPHA